MKKIISLLLAIVLLLGMLPVAALAAGTQPEADSNGVYQIGTAAELLWFAETVNNGNSDISGVLTADVNLKDVDWPGIGNSSNQFSGSFDGQGHTVTFAGSTWGLFARVMGSESKVAEIKNVNTAGSVKLAAIAANAGYVHISNCINRATISSDNSYLGSIVGKVSGITVSGTTKSDVLITQCGNEASISGGEYVGGIVGFSETNTRVQECYNTGNIHGTGNVGGLVGYLKGWTGTCYVKNSYNTGRVTGTTAVGGIIGNQYNDATVSNCYNAGSAYYAVAGNRYNQTSKISNTYFLGTASAKTSPDFNQTQRADEATNEIQTRATAVSASEMASAEFAELLGSSFKQSCPTPVLSWQTAVAHTGDDACENCALGSTEKEQYDVSFPTHSGYTLNGEAKAEQGASYSFTLTINQGYEKGTTFAVKVNGETVTPASNGKYTVFNVDGPLSVTVLGVQVIPGSHAIQFPAEGYGYRVNGANSALRDEDYSFTISMVDGFRAGKDFKVIAQQILSQDLLDKGFEPEEKILTGKDGTYTIPTVQKDYRILVSGVEVVSQTDPVEVNFSITAGEGYFYVDPQNENEMLDRVISVPYFDLSLYGLERYYYNPYCYVDEEGNIRGIQQVGTPESAYDNITVMHAFIVATELYYFNYGQDQVGKGLSYNKENPAIFENAISWTQGVGSSFMDMWDHGTNLNYYVNYEYPLAYPKWGSTSDQILIEDGDVISIHMITGNASGSRFGFFVVNDTDKKFTSDDIVDTYEVDQGEKVNLTLYWTSAKPDYTTGYEQMGGKELYWIEKDNYKATTHRYNDADHLGLDVKEWNRTDFGNTTAAKLVTDDKGNVTISTVGLEPGTYYLATLGGFTETGGMNASGSTTGTGTSGGEAGPAVFKLIVNEYEGKLGDVTNDTKVNAADAAEILKYVAKQISTVNVTVADVTGDGKVNAADAAEILKYVAKQITSFPAENK